MGKEEKEEKVKTKRPTAKKRDIQNAKRQLRNKMLKTRIRGALRAVNEAKDEKDTGSRQEKLNALYSLLDKSVKHKVFKLNKASRLKARASEKV